LLGRSHRVHVGAGGAASLTREWIQLLSSPVEESSPAQPWNTPAISLYLLCAILFPDDIAEYASYRDYFLSRRKRFFGILGLIYVLDVFDTWIKGTAHLVAQCIEYYLRTLAGVVLCVVAARVESRRFHWVFAVGWLAYEVWWILRLYDVLD
jgi:hypothetical protein